MKIYMIDFGFFLTLFKKSNFDELAPHIIFKDEIIHPEIPNCFSSDDLFNFLNIYRPSTSDFQALSEIVKIREYEINDFDICKIDSFADSKSKSADLRFPSVYDFGKSVFIRDGWTIEECIKDLENHAARPGAVLDMLFYAWNQRYAWDNGDGSHHMSTAIFHLKNDPSLPRYCYDVKVKEKFIDTSATSDVFRKYRFFIINSKSWWHIYEDYRNTDGLNIIQIINGMHIVSIKRDSNNQKCKKFLTLCESQNENVCVDLNRYIDDRMQMQLLINDE